MHWFWIFQHCEFLAAVTTVKSFKKFADISFKFVHNLSSRLSRIDIVADSYFDSSLKPDTIEARGCGQFFLFIETTNRLARHFLMHKWNKVALTLSRR